MEGTIKIEAALKFRSKARDVKLSFSSEIQIGKVTGLYGPSGVGKSSFLKVVSGLLFPDEGEVKFGDTCWFSKENKVQIPPGDRSVSFVFQDYGLFPNMTVRKNLLYASPANQISPFIDSLAVRLGIKDYIDSYPEQLSAGQRQRVAILRAFAQESALILMDEPFSALDDEMTLQLIDIIKESVEKNNQTVIVASHRKDTLSHLAEEVILFKGNNVLEKVNVHSGIS